MTSPNTGYAPWVIEGRGGILISRTGVKLIIDGSGIAPSGPAGGDLSGTYPNPTVDGLQGVPIDPGAPVLGEVLTFNGLSAEWLAPTGGPPSGAAGGDLAGLYPNPTVDGLQGVPVDPGAPALGEVLTFNGLSAEWLPSAGGPPSGAAGGDLAGLYPNPTVDGLQGVAVAAAAPANGDVLTVVAGVWTPVAPAGGDLTAITGSEGIVVTAGTGPVPDVALPATTDGNLLVYDTAGPGWEPSSATQDVSALVNALWRIEAASGLFYQLDDDPVDPHFEVNDDIQGLAFRTTSQAMHFSDAALIWNQTVTTEHAVSTADATPTQIFLIPLDDDTATAFDVKVVAKANASANCASFNLSMTWVRDGGGAPVATVQGVTSADAKQTAALATALATMQLSGNSVQGLVTGVIATNLEWIAEVQIVKRTAV